MPTISDYNAKLPEPRKTICNKLFDIIQKYLDDSIPKLYHGSPVWFINENPIVGYSDKKDGIALLFWSGQSFLTMGLKPIGKFKAAEYVYHTENEIESGLLKKWIEEAKDIQWNYKDIIKNNGTLHRLK